MALQTSYLVEKYKLVVPEGYCMVVSTRADKLVTPDNGDITMFVTVEIYANQEARAAGGRPLETKEFSYPYQAVDSGYDAFELAYQILKTQEPLFQGAIDVLED